MAITRYDPFPRPVPSAGPPLQEPSAREPTARARRAALTGRLDSAGRRVRGRRRDHPQGGAARGGRKGRGHPGRGEPAHRPAAGAQSSRRRRTARATTASSAPTAGSAAASPLPSTVERRARLGREQGRRAAHRAAQSGRRPKPRQIKVAGSKPRGRARVAAANKQLAFAAVSPTPQTRRRSSLVGASASFFLRGDRASARSRASASSAGAASPEDEAGAPLVSILQLPSKNTPRSIHDRRPSSACRAPWRGP